MLILVVKKNTQNPEILMTNVGHLKNWHRDTPKPPVMPYNTLISNQPMIDPQITDEQIKKIFEDFCEDDKTMDFGNFRMAVRAVQHTIGQNALH
jgi:hypothetical protein